MSVDTSYVNTDSPAGRGVVYMSEDCTHTKQGMRIDSASPDGVSDAQVGQIHPAYGFFLAGKRDEPNPPPPPPNKIPHYQAPPSNMPVYERMDAVARIGMPEFQSPCDPAAPLVPHSPVEADNDTILRKETRNPVYSKEEGGIDRKRVFRGDTEEEVVTYNKSQRKCCDVKAALLTIFLIMLFFMSAASLMLNLLMLFGHLGHAGCTTCTGNNTEQTSTITEAEVLALRNEFSNSLQELNTSFTELVSLTAGPQGPMGYNGSAGPQGPRGEAGPEAVGGRINLNDYCRTEHKECTITGGSCDTIMTVAPEDILAHWCSVRAGGSFGSSVVVKTASLVTVTEPLIAHKCHCEATLSNGATGTCVYTRVSCHLENVNVILNYPEPGNSTGNN